MKKSLFFAAAAVLALCLTSCKKDEQEVTLTHFTAGIEQAAGQNGEKVCLVGDYFHWTAGDKVTVWGTSDEGVDFTVTPREDDPTWADLGSGSVTGSHFTAVYPGGSFSAPGRNKVFLLPAQQNVAGTPAQFPMYAESDDAGVFQFKNLCGVVKIHVEQANTVINGIAVEADGDIAGTYDVVVNDGIPQLTNCTDGYPLVGMAFMDGQDISSGCDFLFFLPPSGASGYELTVKFAQLQPNDAMYYCEKTGSQRVVVERSKITNITIGSDLAFFPDGSLPGAFSVSATQQVRFSRGNLQWTSTGSHDVVGNGTADGTWRFAKHQYDFVGSDNTNASATYTGWIDLFGWGTSGYHNSSDGYNTNYYPYSITPQGRGNSANYYGYGPSLSMTDRNLTGSSANYDWGVYNAISNGNDSYGIWRTLSKEEWEYLYNDRTDAANKYAVGRIDMGGGTYVNGCIFLPDSWTLPSGCSFTAGVSSSNTDYSLNTYTLAQWAQMEAAGALFLPTAGVRSTRRYGDVNYGVYWSTTTHNNRNSYVFRFNGGVVETANVDRYLGVSVRLVQNL